MLLCWVHVLICVTMLTEHIHSVSIATHISTIMLGCSQTWWSSQWRMKACLETTSMFCSLLCCSDGWLHIWTGETVLGSWFQIRVSQLHSLLNHPGLTHYHHEQCCFCCCALWCCWQHPCIVVPFWWHFGWFFATLWCAVPTAGFGFGGVGPQSRLIIGCTVAGAILLCMLGINREPNKWTLYWGCTNIGNIWQGKDGRGWSLRVMCRTACRGQGLWALGPWARGDHKGISWLHSGSQCHTQVIYGNHIRTGCGGDMPGY